jgi:hypothetical protein
MKRIIFILVLLIAACSPSKDLITTNDDLINENHKLKEEIYLLYNQLDSAYNEIYTIEGVLSDVYYEGEESYGTDEYYEISADSISYIDYEMVSDEKQLISNEYIIKNKYIIKRDTIIINNSTPIYKRYDVGNIAVNVPDTNMKVGDAYNIKLRISKDDIPTESPIMSAHLVDMDEAFEIKKGFVSNMKNIEDDGYVEWEWVVKPIKSGENRLKIIAQVINDDTGQPTEIPVYDNEITIKSDWWFMLSQFFSIHWQWAFGALLVPLITFLYNKYKKKDSEE